MRDEQEMMDLILDISRQDSRIRIMTLEGSRTNVNIPKDEFQDYDVTYFVTDMESFISNDEWLKNFGNIIMMQKPEDMELFPAEERGYSYIMYFDDYNKIDLTFKDPRDLYDFLKMEKPKEEFVFSHGDLGDSNIFVKNGKISGFIDLGRSGKADKWYDIAFCVRSIREDIEEEKYVKLFFDLLGIEPDWEKIRYYILLDELF